LQYTFDRVLDLADECCDFAVVRALRSFGHEVISVQEDFQGISDEKLMGMAREEDRIFLTLASDGRQPGPRAGAGVSIRNILFARRLMDFKIAGRFVDEALAWIST